MKTLFMFILAVTFSTNAQWSTDPTVNNAICTATGNQEVPTIVSDGAGGAIITWYDFRSGNSDIYAQRISSSGAVQWTANDVAICTATGDQYSPTIVSDGAGGAIITWEDHRSGTSYDIYAQRINSSGAVQWTLDGVAICTAVGNQQLPTIISDGAGGAIITWHDYRGSVSPDIYAQQINTSGQLGVVTSVEDLSSAIPQEFHLDQNYPNPFNPSTSIQYAVSSRKFVSLKIYDILGNEIETLVKEEKAAGSYKVEFDASKLSSGIYFYKLQAGSFVETKKMILIK